MKHTCICCLKSLYCMVVVFSACRSVIIYLKEQLKLMEYKVLTIRMGLKM